MVDRGATTTARRESKANRSHRPNPSHFEGRCRRCRSLAAVPTACKNGTPVKKFMNLRINHATKLKRCTWYEPCDSAALDTMVRAACGLSSTTQYLLLDDTMSAVALSSSLPSGLTFEVATVLPAPTDHSKQRAVVIIDPISTGIVLAHQLHTIHGLKIIAVWSDVMPEELKSFVDPRYGSK